jgi:hypothetical protein
MSLVKPVPLPTSDLRAWALQTANYLQSLDAAGKQPSPKVIQLEHVIDLTKASASRDGVLIWSTEQAAVAVSYNKQWYKLAMTLIP